jgi:FxsC-like protein
MSHWFFLSYARENDRDKHLSNFYRDLTNTILEFTAPGEGEDGFFDVRSVNLGGHWRDELISALQNCRTFISLYSPAYFTKDYCGKEWQFFRSRQTAYRSSLPSPNASVGLMLPVLWVPEARLPKSLPEAVSEIQHKHSDFGEVYAREGLRQLMALRKYRDHYREFLVKFANKLIQATVMHAIPPLAAPPSINEIESAFRRSDDVLSADAHRTGPRSVQFIFVAGRRDELREVREKLDFYGEEGGYDWQPFHPDLVDEVGIIAQEVAWREKLHYKFVQLDENIIERLDEAESQNSIVAVIVDAWTLYLSRYSAGMCAYDRRNFVNCVVLITWNGRDRETEINRSTLVNKMWGTFPRHAVKPDPNCFLDSICSPEELKNELRTALNKARARISAKTDVVKRAEGAEFIGKPSITV